MPYLVWEVEPFARPKLCAGAREAHRECRRRYRLMLDAYGYEYAEIYWRERLRCASLAEGAAEALGYAALIFGIWAFAMFFLLL